FTVGPDEFSRDIAALAGAGASIVGGCCGTTPAHIAAARRALDGVKPQRREIVERTIVTSGSRAVEIPLDDTIIIGERINPTGKKKLKAALAEGDVAYILREAVAQADAGAHILDVNVGVPGLDEPSVLDATVQAVQSVTDLPVQIDTSDPAALERALRHYNGKALVNSVNGKEESMAAVFPLVAKYGGAVVALTLDESGIPPTAEGRLAIARKILARGAEYGLKSSDFVIDVLCLAVSADSMSANTILEALGRVKSELGCRTCLGVSNISFGLPARPLLNAAFYTMALGRGLSAGIINPLSADMAAAYRAYRALCAKDPACNEWIAAFAQWSPSASAATGPAKGGAPAADSGGSLSDAIRHGLKSDAKMRAQAALAAGVAPLEIIDGGIVPALETVGAGFEAGKVFLPQLLMAAEAAGTAFDAVREAMPKNAGPAKGPIVMATVKGDIHDIGKNICQALLENYGFKVIDLGRDVPPETVACTAKRENARLVGLSALMTTTVGAMEETIKLLRAEAPKCKIAVGGAVLTADYAEKIGADSYSKDAMGLVRYAERLFKSA
ncbi:MAG: dihydropteroate synthase, partial [Kiritimatiellae bacterium]|nr:dihydropteroate synthase [Kiritimatiellia bacterium]